MRFSKTTFSVLAIATGMCMRAGSVRAQPCEVHELQKVTASDAAADKWFGRSVAMSGHMGVVGQYYGDDFSPDAGSAYVYRYNRNAWVQEAKLTASDRAPGDWFGRSVSISDDVVLVGAMGDNVDSLVRTQNRLGNRAWRYRKKG